MTPPSDPSGLDRARRARARARLRHHERRELHALQLAVRAEHDPTARLFEARADQAYLDALAIAGEHHIPPMTEHR
jgi:hypothetical protein